MGAGQSSSSCVTGACRRDEIGQDKACGTLGASCGSSLPDNFPPSGLIKGQEGDVFACEFSPDGNYLMTSGDEGKLNVYDTKTWTLVHNLNCRIKNASEAKHSDPRSANVKSVCFSEDGALMAAGTASGHIYIWKQKSSSRYSLSSSLVDSSTDTNILRPPPPQPQGETKSPSWRMETLLSGHSKTVSCLCFVEGNKLLLSGSADGNAILWDLSSMKQFRKVRPNHQPVNTCALSSKGLIAIGTMASPSSRPSKNIALTLWDSSLKCVRREWLVTYTSDRGNNPASVIYHDVSSVHFSPDGEILATCLSCALWIFETKTFNRIHQVQLMGCAIPSCSFSSSGDLFVFTVTRVDVGWCWEKGAENKELERPTVWVYCGKEFKPLNRLKGHGRIIMDCSISPDETIIASVSKVKNTISFILPQKRVMP
eukprot:jgi/Bigna1/89268/estExt_fgenesh1_pg.C_460071